MTGISLQVLPVSCSEGKNIVTASRRGSDYTTARTPPYKASFKSLPSILTQYTITSDTLSGHRTEPTIDIPSEENNLRHLQFNISNQNITVLGLRSTPPSEAVETGHILGVEHELGHTHQVGLTPGLILPTKLGKAHIPVLPHMSLYRLHSAQQQDLPLYNHPIHLHRTIPDSGVSYATTVTAGQDLLFYPLARIDTVGHLQSQSGSSSRSPSPTKSTFTTLTTSPPDRPFTATGTFYTPTSNTQSTFKQTTLSPSTFTTTQTGTGTFTGITGSSRDTQTAPTSTLRRPGFGGDEDGGSFGLSRRASGKRARGESSVASEGERISNGSNGGSNIDIRELGKFLGVNGTKTPLHTTSMFMQNPLIVGNGVKAHSSIVLVSSYDSASERDDVGAIAAREQDPLPQSAVEIGLIETLVPFWMVYRDGVERLACDRHFGAAVGMDLKDLEAINTPSTASLSRAPSLTPSVAPLFSSLTRTITRHSGSPTGSIRTIMSMDSSSSVSSTASSGTGKLLQNFVPESLRQSSAKTKASSIHLIESEESRSAPPSAPPSEAPRFRPLSLPRPLPFLLPHLLHLPLNPFAFRASGMDLFESDLPLPPSTATALSISVPAPSSVRRSKAKSSSLLSLPPTSPSEVAASSPQ
ncbi:hypothetical protein EV361DRAFT_950843 [Lentinula raphanica]|uniref:Uncharacterized protein n=1 Tax=Lentinula raphanica TaxID=153919 RepID=A0AA38P3F5_9AGAR|nr:hypothetical protein EV360DRAFT_84716 [Lentinula raphanica]KAJ3835593.1 hypothetical protein F5878DRAFT_692276 [Lentinula raphanica]KAJ3970140.1 hypothetical protein EV361DRAFT_950843 [Lentinula raphanica]